MKSKFFAPLAAALLLSACATTGDPTFGVDPVEMPDLPSELDKKAERLPPITDPSLAGQVRAGVEADEAYNDVAHRNNRLIDFYYCVQEAINEEGDLADCLGVEEDEEL